MNASTTGDCSSRLQDSEVDVLRVRVGVLEGALRDALSWIENYPLNAGQHFDGEWHGQAEKLRAVLAGGEAAPDEGPATRAWFKHKAAPEPCPYCKDFDAAGGEAGKEKP